LLFEEQAGDFQADFRSKVRQAILQHCRYFFTVEHDGNAAFLLILFVGLGLP